MIHYRVTINGIGVEASYSERAVGEIFVPLLDWLEDLRWEKAAG